MVYVPQYFRVVRNQSAQVKAELFVEAARSLGAGPLWILRRYLFRNVITSVPVLLTLNAADAVLVLGGLGFLGLGLPETVPEWGSDLQQAQRAAHRRLVDGAVPRRGDVCVGAGALVRGRGPRELAQWQRQQQPGAELTVSSAASGCAVAARRFHLPR